MELQFCERIRDTLIVAQSGIFFEHNRYGVLGNPTYPVLMQRYSFHNSNRNSPQQMHYLLLFQ